MAAGYPSYYVGYPPAAPATGYGAPPNNCNSNYSLYPGYGSPSSQPHLTPPMPGAGACSPLSYQAPPESFSGFRVVDRNNSTRMGVNELSAALSNSGFRFSLGTTEMLLRRYDLDRSGTITTEELADLQEFLSTLQQGFRLRDTSGDGRLDRLETRAVLHQSGFALSEETFEAVMRAFDRQHRGSLSFDDYVELSVFMEQARDAFSYFDPDYAGAAVLNFDIFVGLEATLC
ncbi:EF hand-like protein [Leptomonas seymouri]|uniref:EF hand-like protein n=1 Tax=Leptomonas seymouri TaxID=5684 RepID=A0A0N0P8K6_LEPSE|nr:EF hand-like protein [Leptomonas seymouri]|eukprot:KPI89647.1 EF hand-like protein [Leptomonas seymouri]